MHRGRWRPYHGIWLNIRNENVFHDGCKIYVPPYHPEPLQMPLTLCDFSSRSDSERE